MSLQFYRGLSSFYEGLRIRQEFYLFTLDLLRKTFAGEMPKANLLAKLVSDWNQFQAHQQLQEEQIFEQECQVSENNNEYYFKTLRQCVSIRELFEKSLEVSLDLSELLGVERMVKSLKQMQMRILNQQFIKFAMESIQYSKGKLKLLISLLRERVSTGTFNIQIQQHQTLIDALRERQTQIYQKQRLDEQVRKQNRAKVLTRALGNLSSIVQLDKAQRQNLYLQGVQNAMERELSLRNLRIKGVIDKYIKKSNSTQVQEKIKQNILSYRSTLFLCRDQQLALAQDSLLLKKVKPRPTYLNRSLKQLKVHSPPKERRALESLGMDQVQLRRAQPRVSKERDQKNEIIHSIINSEYKNYIHYKKRLIHAFLKKSLIKKSNPFLSLKRTSETFWSDQSLENSRRSIPSFNYMLKGEKIKKFNRLEH